MMRSELIFFICCFLISGCTDAYYQSQGEYYKAQAAAIAAQKPLSSVTLTDGTIITTANPNDRKTITPARNPVFDVISTIVNSSPASILAGGWSTREIVGASVGDNNSVSTVDRHDSVSEPTIVTQPAPTIMPAVDPVIVTQPEPMIVRPEVVSPETVNIENIEKIE